MGLQTNNMAGLSLAVSRNGRLIYAKGYGHADRQANEWMNPHHRLRIGSVSKMFTSAGVMRLRETGVLFSVDRKVFGAGALLGTQYGTQPYSAREQAITVRHLLNHTGGWLINNVTPFTSDYDAFMGRILDVLEPDYEPGTRFDYYNDGYFILGRVIEELSGQTYEHYVQAAVLSPCGVTDMEVGGPTLAERKAREVVYHSAGNPYTIPWNDAAGAWIAKPMDMLLFLRRFNGDPANTDLINPLMFNAMQTDGADQNYGFGVMLRPWFNLWGHNGGMNGTMGMLRQYSDGMAVAVLCNQDGPMWDAFVDSIVAQLRTIPVAAWPDYDLFPSANLAFDAWTVDHFDITDRTYPGLKADIWGPGADPDKNGFPNAVEAGFGLDPWQRDSAPYKPSRVGNEFVLRWLRPATLDTHGVRLETQVTYVLGLQDWMPGPPVQIAGDSPIGFTTQETRLPMGGHARAFERFGATTP